MSSWSLELDELEKYLNRIKGQVQSLEKELHSLLKASEEVTALLFARRSLEVMVSDLCETELKRQRGTEPLQGIVDKLFRDEIVPESIHTAMSNLIRISNYGAHPKDFDPRQVRGALIDLSVVVEWFITFKKYPVNKPDLVEVPHENKVETIYNKEQVTSAVQQNVKPETIESAVKDPVPKAGKDITGIKITDHTGTLIELKEFGIIYNLYEQKMLSKSIREFVVIENGSAIQKIPWDRIQRIEIHDALVSKIILTDSKTIDSTKLQTGTLVGLDNAEFLFVLDLSKIKSMMILRHVDKPKHEPETIESGGKDPVPKTSKNITGIKITDHTGTLSELKEFGIVYNLYEQKILSKSIREFVIIESGSAIQEIPWNRIQLIEISGNLVSKILLTDSKSIDSAKMRTGTLVGLDKAEFPFVLDLSKIKSLMILRDGDKPKEVTRIVVPMDENTFATDPQKNDCVKSSIITNEPDGTELMLIPEGEYLAGWPSDGSNPPFPVSLKAYYIALYQVTNEQYARFLNEYQPEIQELKNWIFLDASCFVRKTTSGYEAFPGKADHPVVQVTWFGANAYCKWAGLRLPTELEWEKAARGIDGRIYPWGNEWDASKCRFAGNKAGETTCSVKDFAEGVSPYGIFQMAGNVLEWCADGFQHDSYDKFWKGDLALPDGVNKVLRGGSWMHSHEFCNSIRHFGNDPNLHYNFFGFRCVK